jgi:ADP-ribose pyrophosphatase YjhB (NUDIX family)
MKVIKVIVGVSLVKDNKILMVQEGKEHCRGQWNIPAGHLEYGENMKKSAIREIFEETGYKIGISGITGLYNYISKTQKQCIRINFIGNIESGKLKIDGEEILDANWFSFDELKAMDDDKLRSPNVLRQVLKDTESGKNYPLDILDEEME